MSANNKGAAPIDLLSFPKVPGATIAEGAVVKLTDFNTVGLPAGAADKDGVWGVAKAAAVSTDPYVPVQWQGVALVLGAAAEVITLGARLITANASGHVKAIAATTDVDVIGRAMRAQTIGASAELIPVLLGTQYED